METFDHRGRAVAYDRYGSGSPIVLLHNAGANRRIWDEQVAALRSGHEVFALDLPGYGHSERPADGYRLADYTALLDAFVEAHRLTDVTLIGNCLGAATSLSYAIRHPDRVRGLVLINLLTRNTVRRGRSAALAWADGKLPLGRPAEALRLPALIIDQIVTNQLGERGRARQLQRSEKLRAFWGDKGRLAALHGLVQGFPAYAALDTFTPPANFPPICTIWGAQNRILSAEAGARVNLTLRPRTAEVLADCGHLPMVEDPERVTAIIQEFLVSTPEHPVRQG
ncbi:alpha/beta fold hydrolase [Nocardia jejuensis]|uniref:alpha/beta fold hydrolase n=1 Tax=Nocardia jejuensis TaxID=328049 RepID=UPI00082BF331|nr:alpha/beta hydrolase [Nocardia jejuensis]